MSLHLQYKSCLDRQSRLVPGNSNSADIFLHTVDEDDMLDTSSMQLLRYYPVVIARYYGSSMFSKLQNELHLQTSSPQEQRMRPGTLGR